MNTTMNPKKEHEMKKKLFAMLATVAAICAQAVTTTELLTNGAGTTLDGWVNSYSTSGGTFAIQQSDGVSWFASSHDVCQLSQTVTLSDHGFTDSDIAANPTVTASGVVLANFDKNGSGSTICNVKVYEINASGDTIATHVIMDRAEALITTPETFSNSFSLNSNTRKLKYELNGKDKRNWDGLYGPKFRNCSLTIPPVWGGITLQD